MGYFEVSGQEQSNEQTLDDSKKLIHIVLIEFKSTVSKTDMQLVVDAAYSLQQIEGVKDLNFGENTSPE